MSNTVKLLQVFRTKIFSPVAITNRSFHSSKFQNLPLLRRNSTYLAPIAFLPRQSTRLLTNYTSPDMSAASTPTSTPTTPITDGYDIVPVQKEDTERALEFLRRFFFRDEPLNVEQNLLETDADTCPELEEFSVKSIHEGVSLMATAPNGDIVGLCLNGILRRDDPEEEPYVCPNKKFAKILKLLDTVDREANIFGQFPDVDKMLSVKILSVDGSWRGRGIAKALMDRSRDICREGGCTLMRVDCTSHFSARAVARLGFECVYTLNYSDYKENDKPVFVPEPPHSEVKVYTQRVTK